jgi:hypothetical protein
MIKARAVRQQPSARSLEGRAIKLSLPSIPLLAHVIEHRRQIGHPLFGQRCPCAGFRQLPMQFLGLDAQLPELTARTAQAARLDRTQYAGLEHARSGRSIRDGERGDGVHAFRAVAQSMIRNGAPAMVTKVFMPSQGSRSKDWFHP